MSIFYRMRVYDDDDTTVLTPTAGAPHSNAFAVTNYTEHTDTITFKPYLEGVRGRRGAVNLFAKTNDTGIGEVRLLDKRTTVGGSNLSRWVTTFLGDAKKKQRLIGKKFLIEESTDGGSTWSDYFTGHIAKISWGQDKIWCKLQLRDTRHIMKQTVFEGTPHSSITGAYRPSVLPNGLVNNCVPAHTFGNVYTVPQITAEVDTVGQFSMVLKNFTLNNYAMTRARLAMHPLLQSLWDQIDNRTPTFNVADADFPEVMRANIRRTTPSAVDKDFRVTALSTKSNLGVTIVNKVQVTYLADVTDPKFSAMSGVFSPGQTVYFHIFPGKDTPVSADYPIFVDDRNHKQILREILDGKYGKLNADGTVRWSIPYNSTDLTNDDTRPEARGVISGAQKLEDILTNWCQQYNYCYRFDESGELRLIDTRPPSAVLSPSTITDADLADGGNPTWEVADDTVVNEFLGIWYWDNHLMNEAIVSTAHAKQTVPPGCVVFAPQKVRAVGGFSDHKPKEKVIDGTWLHGNVIEANFGAREATFKRNWITGLVTEMLGPYGRGQHMITLRCRRRATGGNPEGCIEGDWRIIDVDALPDPGTNQRGGARLGRCVSRYNDGGFVVLTFLDMGEDLQLTAPTFTSVAQVTGAETNAQVLTVTLNADTDPVRVEYSVTTTGIAVRPTTGWQFGGLIRSSGTFNVSHLPPGSRIWWRIRSEVTDGNRLKHPSTWTYPTSPAAGYVDTNALGSCTGLSDTVNGLRAVATWTLPAGSTGLRVQVLLAPDAQTLEVIGTLPPGTTRYGFSHLRDGTVLAANTVYDWGVRVVGEDGTPGPTAADTFTTGSTPTTCPDMLHAPFARSLGGYA